MKRTVSVLAFLFVLGWFTYSNATLYDAWVSFSSVIWGGMYIRILSPGAQVAP